MINLALIGAGTWGKNYIETLNEMPGVRLKYICTKSSETLNKLDKKYLKTTDFREIFNKADLGGVIIATPNSAHFEILSEAIKKDLSVLIEKPLVESYSQAKKLNELSKKSKSYVQVGHIYMFDPAFIKAKEEIKKIGKMRYVAFEGTGNFPIRKNTSVLWDIGVHAVSLCLDVVSKNPISIKASGVSSLYPNTEFIDFSEIEIEFEDELKAFIKVSWMFPFKKRELVVVGQSDAVVYDAQSDKKVHYLKNLINKSEVHTKSNSVANSFPKYSDKSPLECEIEAFLSGIKNKKARRSDLEFGLRVTRVIELAIKSTKNDGKRINFSL